MRVLHLSTHDLRGGAAKSAWRLHQGLLEIGVDSRVLCRTKHSDDERVQATDEGTLAAWHEQISTPWLQRRLPAGSPWCTSGALHFDVSPHPWVGQADVLHLHWVAEWLTAPAIARLASLGKPLVWTFHDLWAVTGGLHYPGDNTPGTDAWQTGEALPPVLAEVVGREFKRKQTHLAPLPLQIVSPSQWLARQSQASHIGRHWQTQVIAYGIDTSIFLPSASPQAGRQRLGLPEDAICLLFGCASLNEERKGFDKLRQALQQAAEDPAFASAIARKKVLLLLFGAESPQLDNLPVPAQHLGLIRSEADMAALYQTADAYLCPTLEDNLPNTVIESLACGTPVIGFETGGVPDLVRHRENGLLAPCGDVPAFAAHLISAVTDPEVRRTLQTGTHSTGLDRYALRTQARRVQAVYESLPLSTSTDVNVGKQGTDMRFFEEDMGWLMTAAAEALHHQQERTAVLQQKLDKARIKAGKSPAPAPRRRWWQRG